MSNPKHGTWALLEPEPRARRNNAGAVPFTVWLHQWRIFGDKMDRRLAPTQLRVQGMSDNMDAVWQAAHLMVRVLNGEVVTTATKQIDARCEPDTSDILSADLKVGDRFGAVKVESLDRLRGPDGAITHILINDEEEMRVLLDASSTVNLNRPMND